MAAVADGGSSSSHRCSTRRSSCRGTEDSELPAFLRADSDSLSAALSTEESSPSHRDLKDYDAERATLYQKLSGDEMEQTQTMVVSLRVLYEELEETLEPFCISECKVRLRTCCFGLPKDSPLMRRRTVIEGEATVTIV